MTMYLLRAYRIFSTRNPREKYTKEESHQILIILGSCVVAFIMAVFFFAFVMCMCYDQYEAFTTGVPGVDAMQTKGELPRVQSCRKGFLKMVIRNEPFSWRWFVPIAANVPRIPPPPLSDIQIFQAAENDTPSPNLPEAVSDLPEAVSDKKTE
jgi:hypothetical protein